jgi:hypothetical protein
MIIQSRLHGWHAYFDETERVLEKVWLHYAGARYEGRGIMRWKPDEGFHIDAFLDRHGPPLSGSIELGKTGVAQKSDARLIWMKPTGEDWAVTPKIILRDRLDLLTENRLSIKVPRVLFYKRYEINPAGCPGYALFATGSPEIILPDSVQTDLRIAGHEWEKRLTSGLWHEGNPDLVGRYVRDSVLEMRWTFPETNTTIRKRSWVWGPALAEAFSVLLGRSVRLLERRIQVSRGVFFERQRQREVESLGVLSPISVQGVVRKDDLLKLTEFFAASSDHARICRSIFAQLLEASRQKTWPGTELLCATILEAALRTLDKHPFRPSDNSWKIKESIHRFRERFLSDEWESACDRVFAVRRRLRHRNAHPDWLAEGGGSRSEGQMTESLDDLIFLSRFYGYMILALAGWRGLKPVFPPPHREWKGSFTVSWTKPKAEDGNSKTAINTSPEHLGENVE